MAFCGVREGLGLSSHSSGNNNNSSSSSSSSERVIRRVPPPPRRGAARGRGRGVGVEDAAAVAAAGGVLVRRGVLRYPQHDQGQEQMTESGVEAEVEVEVEVEVPLMVPMSGAGSGESEQDGWLSRLIQLCSLAAGSEAELVVVRGMLPLLQQLGPGFRVVRHTSPLLSLLLPLLRGHHSTELRGGVLACLRELLRWGWCRICARGSRHRMSLLTALLRVCMAAEVVNESPLGMGGGRTRKGGLMSVEAQEVELGREAGEVWVMVACACEEDWVTDVVGRIKDKAGPLLTRVLHQLTGQLEEARRRRRKVVV